MPDGRQDGGCGHARPTHLHLPRAPQSTTVPGVARSKAQKQVAKSCCGAGAAGTAMSGKCRLAGTTSTLWRLCLPCGSIHICPLVAAGRILGWQGWWEPKISHKRKDWQKFPSPHKHFYSWKCRSQAPPRPPFLPFSFQDKASSHTTELNLGGKYRNYYLGIFSFSFKKYIYTGCCEGKE